MLSVLRKHQATVGNLSVVFLLLSTYDILVLRINEEGEIINSNPLVVLQYNEALPAFDKYHNVFDNFKHRRTLLSQYSEDIDAKRKIFCLKWVLNNYPNRVRYNENVG